MKRFIFFCALSATVPLLGFYAGVGVGFNSIDESFKSTLSTNENRSGKDQYSTHQNRLVPMVTVGHQWCFCDDWSIGITAEWKYLNYRTPNDNSSRGQILPNASFSSINIFGPEVVRDFTSISRLNNEVLLLASIERELCGGFIYLGLGPMMFDASNSINVSSVHTPNGTGDHLVSTSVKEDKIIWGGAARVGYQYFLTENAFINAGYTYLQTGRTHFKNSANTARLNGFDTPGETTLLLKRSIRFTAQEFFLSMNLLF